MQSLNIDKGMKTVGDTDYTNQTPSKHFGQENVEISKVLCFRLKHL